ncbi:MAG: DEAD/DEAH box helicase, partial [Thermoprotei archaeon]
MILDKRLALEPKLEAIVDSLFTNFTEPQVRAFDRIIQGDSVVLCSETGSGKTEAALIPIIHLLLSKERPPGTSAVYITPLRALNRDIEYRLRKLTQALGLTLGTRHGDTRTAERKKMRENPPDILVTTPETFQALITEETNLRNFRNVRFLVVDEANELIQSKRGTQLVLGINRFENYLSRKIQIICLSATVKSGRFVNNYFLNGSGKVIYIGSTRRYDILLDVPTSQNQLSSIVKAVERHLEERCIVFTNTRQLAESISRTIDSKGTAVNIAVHHSSLSQSERIAVEQKLKKGQVQAVISTSSLELGLDLGAIRKVVQVASPKTVETLAQRVGRSGHGAKKTSVGVIVGINQLDLLESASIARLLLKRWMERPTSFSKPFDVLAHQLAGHLLVVRRTKASDMFDLVTSCYPYRDLSMTEFEGVLEHLVKNRAARIDGEYVARSSRTKSYFYRHLGTIITTRQFQVFDLATRASIGSLDPSFVEKFCEQGKVIVLGKRSWEIVSIDFGAHTVNVRRGAGSTATVPAWTGDVLPVDDYVAKGVFDIVRSKKRGKVLAELRLSEQAKQALSLVPPVQNLRSDVLYLALIHGRSNVLFALSPLGTRGNRAMSLLLQELLSEQYVDSSAYPSSVGTLLTLAPTPQVSAVAERLTSLTEEEARRLIQVGAMRYGRFTDRLFRVAERLGFDVEEITEKLGIRRTHAVLSNTLAGSETLKELFDEVLDVREVLKIIKKKAVVVIQEEGALSKLVNTIVSSMHIEAGSESESDVLSAAKTRLENKLYQVACLSCFNFQTQRRVREINEGFSCPKCGSKYMGFVSQNGSELRRALELIKTGKTASEPSLAQLQKELVESATIYLDFGRRGLLALSGFGVGPTTVKRILRKRVETETQLVSEILKAEQD